MKIADTLTWFFARAACGGCGKDVYALRRTCPACGRRYPTARPAFYWAYVAVSVLAVPALIVFAVKTF